MSNILLDPPNVERPVETPIEPQATDDMPMQAPPKSIRPISAERLGAHLTIGAVALFLLAMLAIVAILSTPSAQLLTLDGAIALGILVLSLALSFLLAAANRRQGA